MNRYVAIKPWIASAPGQIVLIAGQQVAIDISRKGENPQWQGWVWCRSQHNEGWVPEQVLEILAQDCQSTMARVRQSYSGRELDIDPGEVVAGETIINGWLWCHKEGESDYGWLPLENLSPAT